MKKIVLFTGGILVSFAFSLVAHAAGPWYVDPAGSDSNTCTAPGSANACLTIQHAMSLASPGDTINLAAGTYTEQVIVSEPLTIIGAGATTIIQSPETLVGTAGFVDIHGDAVKPVVSDVGSDLTIQDLTIDGDGQGNANYSFVGLGIENANLTADSISIIGVRDNPLDGDQDGNALYVYNQDGTSRTASVTNSSFSDFQKNAIVLNGAGLTGTVTGNTVTGAGATPSIAQNGVEIIFGAAASISGNTISGFEYSGTDPSQPSGPDPIADVQSAGVELYQVGGGVTVSDNTISDSDMGLYNLLLAAGTTTISGNTFTDNRYGGIEYDQGNADITDNNITGGAIGIAGLMFSSDTANSTALVTGNTVNGAADSGIKLVEDSSEDTFSPMLTATNNDLSSNAVGVQNDVAAAANATCNWWGAADGPGPVGPGSGDDVSTNVTFSDWLTSSDLTGSCSGGTNVMVIIDKFIDGKMATASSASSDAFPMVSSWNAVNLGGAGSGSYDLGTDDSYQAQTAPMTFGASYTTNEVTGGAVVGASCSTGQPYVLVGYSRGPTLAAAQSSTVSATAPNFTNLTTDEYVIVWNKACLPAPVNVSPADGTTLTTATWTEADWTSVTDPFGPIEYFYESANSSAVNPDGSFASPVYQSAALGTPSIPTPGTPAGTWFWHARAEDADGNMSAWSTPTEVIVNNTPPLKVHILKYLDGAQATAASTNSYLFPMASQWQTANLDGGAISAGTYVLGDSFGGSLYLYGADTAAMDAPANYATQELTNDVDSSSKVLPVGAGCVAGDYELQGYQTSPVSFAAAATAALSPTAPSFVGLTADEYVIVSNITCPTTGTLVVNKEALGSDGTFTFTGTNGIGTFSITTTAGAGSATFANLAPGTYTVTETNIQKGWQEIDSDCASVLVTAGGTETCTITDAKGSYLGEIRGTKYEDKDGDGSLKDGDHHRLSGWTIHITGPNNFSSSTITDKYGNYEFKNLVPGTYTVTEVEQAGWTETYPADDMNVVNLKSGQIAKRENFGNFKLGTISGMKFNDLNGDGHKESNEPGLSGWTIKLTKVGAPSFIETDVTAANGDYSFTDLGPGTYKLSEVQQAGWHETTIMPNIKILSGMISKNNNIGNHYGKINKNGRDYTWYHWHW